MDNENEINESETIKTEDSNSASDTVDNSEASNTNETIQDSPASGTSGNVDKGGNWFSKQPTIVKVILGIVAVCCIGIIILGLITILVPDGVNYQFSDSTDKFPIETEVSGVTFHLPEGYLNIQNDTSNAEYKTYSYLKGSDEISITTYPSLSKEKILTNIKSNSGFTNFGDASFGGTSGTTADYTVGSDKKIFLFEKGGETFLIEMTNSDNFSEYMPKIIG